MDCGYSFENALDLIYNENVIIYEKIYSKEDYAEEYVQEMGSWCGVEIPRDSSLWLYLDWERISKELFSGDLTYDSDYNMVLDFNV